MKKSVIVLWIVAALFFLCSFQFLPDSLPEFICGIALAAVLFFIGWTKFNRQRKAVKSAEAKRAEEKQRAEAYAATHGVINTSLSGVTFNNDDGSSRQYALKLAKGMEGRGEYYEVRLDPYTFKGNPAIYVFADGRCVGNIKAEDVPAVMRVLDNLDYIDLQPYSFTSDDHRRIYTANIDVHYFKK